MEPKAEIWTKIWQVNIKVVVELADYILYWFDIRQFWLIESYTFKVQIKDNLLIRFNFLPHSQYNVIVWIFMLQVPLIGPNLWECMP